MARKVLTVAIASVIAALLIGVAALYAVYASSDEWEVRGQIGDSFNVLTSVFSIFGFLGLSLTLVLQRIDLNTQMDAVRAELNVNKSSVLLQERQAKLDGAIRLQDFYEKRLLWLQSESSDGARHAEIIRQVEDFKFRIRQLENICDNEYNTLGD